MSYAILGAGKVGQAAKLLAVFIADTGDNALTIPDQAGGSR
jgi:hypothetical protein